MREQELLPFYQKNSLTEWPSRVLWNLLLLMKPSDALQNGLFEHKNAKSRVGESQTCNLRTTPSFVLNMVMNQGPTYKTLSHPENGCDAMRFKSVAMEHMIYYI